jgi:phosphatidylserine/phosphatidylglycerophosphate/cardiolipin synthase-like enzyme
VGFGSRNGKIILQPFYVHSKISIVDDKWDTIGTANLDESSLSGAEKFKQVT